MAAETISELYFRLGLDVSDLNSGFVNAEQTLSQNLQNLNRQKNLIQLRAQVKLSGLDEAAVGTAGLRVRLEELNQQMQLQSDKIKLTAAAYKEMVEAQGENSTAAYNLAFRLEQERLAMARLQQQSQALSNQEQIALGMNWEMLGLVEPTLKMIDLAAGSRRSLSVLGRAIPMPYVKMAAAAFVGLSAAVSGTVEATSELRENNAAQIFAENAQNASASFGDSSAAIRNEAILTSNAIAQSFGAIGNAAHQYMQEPPASFTDFARDFFRVAFLLADESDNFSDAISKINSQSQFMRTELGETAVVVAGIYHTLNALANSAISFVKPSIEDFKNLQLRADELNISLNKTRKLQSLMDLAGADYNDVRDFVRGVQDAVIKGDAEDPEVIALEKYGVVIQDANGQLISFDETLERLYQGFLKAREAGEAEAYVIMTNGQAVQDVLPFFERWAAAEKSIGKIKWATQDFAALQKTTDSLKLLEIQTNEFENSVHSLGLPIADFAAQTQFAFYKRLTALVEENRETILYWEFVLVEALKRFQNVVDAVLDSLMGKAEETENIFTRLAKKIATTFTGNKLYSYLDFKDYEKNFFDVWDDVSSGKDVNDFMAAFPKPYQFKDFEDVNYQRMYDNYQSSWSILRDEMYKDAIKFNEILPEKYKDQGRGIDFTPKESPSIFEDAKKDVEEYIEANEQAREETKKTAEEIEAGLSYSYNRIAKYKEELANIKIDLQFGDDDYGKSLAKLDVWFDTAMRDAKYYAQEQSALNDLYAAKAEQIEKTRLENLEQIRSQYADSHQTELEKQLAAIEAEADAWIKVGMEADEALELAEKRKTQAIRQIEKEFATSNTELHQSELEKRLAQIESEKQAWVQKGIDEVKATRAAEQQKAEVLKQLENEFAARVNSLNQTDIAQRFSEIEREQKEWIERGIDASRAIRFSEAQEMDAIKELNDEWAEHINSIYQTSLDQRLAQIEKEKQAWIQKGIDEVRATQAAEQQKVDARREAAMSVIRTQLKELEIFNKGGYSALQAYKLDELVKTANVNPRLLRDLTPQMVSNFQEALRVAEKSLLPNFMTEQDKADSLRMREQFPNPAIQNRQSELERILQGITVNGETPQIDLSQGLNEGLSVFSTNIDAASTGLSELTAPIVDLTEKLSDLSGIIYELSAPQTERQYQRGDSRQSSQPLNITVNVSIDEAHAWDSEHIQELADKVADEIQPEIVNAIGGDSNRY